MLACWDNEREKWLHDPHSNTTDIALWGKKNTTKPDYDMIVWIPVRKELMQGDREKTNKAQKYKKGWFMKFE